MSYDTVLYKEFDPERLLFSDKSVSMNETGTTTSVRVTYDYPSGNESRLLIQTPKLVAPFGIGNGEKFGNPNKWTLQLSLSGDKKPVQSFRKCLESLDNRVIQEALKRPKEIGHIDDDDDEKVRMKFAKKAYLSKIAKNKDAKKAEKYGDTFKLSVPWDPATKAPRETVKFYDKDDKEVTVEALNKGSTVICLFAVDSVWTSNLNQYGLIIKLVQCKIVSSIPLGGKIKSFAIKPDSDDEGPSHTKVSDDEEHEEPDDVNVEDPDEI